MSFSFFKKKVEESFASKKKKKKKNQKKKHFFFFSYLWPRARASKRPGSSAPAPSLASSPLPTAASPEQRP